MTGVQIMCEVARRHNIRFHEMKRSVGGQGKVVVAARTEAIYLIKRDLGYSLTEVGRLFGMHRSSVLAALQRADPSVNPVEKRMSVQDLQLLVRSLESRVEELEKHGITCAGN